MEHASRPNARAPIGRRAGSVIVNRTCQQRPGAAQQSNTDTLALTAAPTLQQLEQLARERDARSSDVQEVDTGEIAAETEPPTPPLPGSERGSARRPSAAWKLWA